MEKETDYVSKLNNILTQDIVDNNELNIILDKLIVNLHYKTNCNKKIISSSVTNICKLPSQNALLAAKISNFIYNVAFKQKINFEPEQLDVIIPWLVKSIQNLSDIAFLDVLQVMNVLIKNHGDYFLKQSDDIITSLLINLEDKTNINSIDVLIYRLNNLKLLIVYSKKNKQNDIAKSLFETVYKLKADNYDVQAKIWTCVIESLDVLCSKYRDWLNIYLNDVVGLIEAACEIGFDRNIVPPKPLLPSNVIVPPQVHPTSGEVKAKAKVTVQKKSSKVKQVNWSQQNESDKEDGVFRAGVDVYNTSRWNQSESDQSDSEARSGFKINKLQARTRHSAYNLLIQLVKVFGTRPLYGYYAVLMGKITTNLRRETLHKPKITALAAITALLSSSKNFLAQAQHRVEGSFTTFSESLSHLIENLHSILGQLLKTWNLSVLIAPLLHTVAALISVSPYKKLAPSLLTNTFRVIQPHLNSKDSGVLSGVLLCVTEIVVLNPVFDEQINILTSGGVSNEPLWPFTHCINILKQDGSDEILKVSVWQLLRGLVQCHYDLIKNHLSILEPYIFKELNKLDDSKRQFFVGKTLDYVLLKLLYDDEMCVYRKDLWMKLIKGPLVPMAQSSTNMASIACDCISSIGPQVYNILKEDEQILLVTLPIGCCFNELSCVRAAAINTLGIFLLFPQVLSEKFIFDTKDILIQGLKDGNDLARSRAAWSFGNLTEILKNNDLNLISEMSLVKLFEAGMSVFKDYQNVKSNILRAMKNLMLLVTEDDLTNNELKNHIIKSANFFVSCATTGKLMKMRWNACYAIGTMLTNEVLYSVSNDWLGSIIQNLCSVLLKCRNFKVRINACNALVSIKSRKYFTPYYNLVVTSLLDGLENAANMTDFREFNHQDDLKQKLCYAVCHMISLASEEDIEELSLTMDYRFESFKTNIEYFINCAPPERTSIVISASNNISNLKSKTLTSSHTHFLNILLKIFEIVSPQVY